MTSLEACPGCGARFAPFDGPVHAYLESSAACWHAFGQVLARDYSNGALEPIHRLTVDAYCAQHPGGESRQAIQSVGIHLSRLRLVFECGLAPGESQAAIARIAEHKASMFELERPASLGSLTIADVLRAETAAEQIAIVERWAGEVWRAWAQHRETIRAWSEAGAAATKSAAPSTNR